ncbi:hypothetical protein CLAFUW4_13367 [Fulvia fulva]|uniref:Uncharacterized protein n=1 Tax=Passalora fulva TaxID=5499 RepID=A0A9Q8PJK8_PASFU|nr:uncharacterized protein CLAFUR5_13220 [Fulvia fulva]KAK4611666.1 hypothetical protein CLAFUR4_13371 [Fulvia fulva]KAK4613007.1 hypothetical protein CLAFUR0_13377 [Fulvia fulva]UJO23597.1 hypothetical protein CLAFUR5_13220 [Fulvia fulva]WPV21357.1 hypothetical protein CLAFUW4_13367 [Fulvia fulva]WPV35896.1 hypothetical protein CLAFUW7_13374 [Fulvia fulva]
MSWTRIVNCFVETFADAATLDAHCGCASSSLFDSFATSACLHSVDRITGFLPFTLRDYTLNPTLEQLNGEGFNTPWSALFLSLALKQRKDRGSTAQFPINRFNQFPELRDLSARTDVPSWMKIIRHVQTVDDLKDLQRDEEKQEKKDGTVNFNNLRQYDPESNDKQTKNTIEFRQHAGTLRGPEVIAWTRLLVSLMTYCNDTPEDEVDGLCMKAWSDPSWTALDLMKAIGMSESSDTYKHYKHVLGFYSRSEPYADIVREQEIKDLRLHGPCYFFADMMQMNIDRRHKRNSRAEVEKRIAEKFRKGSYGQYSAEYLKQLGPMASPSAMPSKRRGRLLKSMRIAISS